MKKPYFLSRFLALWLTLSLSLPAPVFAMRTENLKEAGAEEQLQLALADSDPVNAVAQVIAPRLAGALGLPTVSSAPLSAAGAEQGLARFPQDSPAYRFRLPLEKSAYLEMNGRRVRINPTWIAEEPFQGRATGSIQDEATLFLSGDDVVIARYFLMKDIARRDLTGGELRTFLNQEVAHSRKKSTRGVAIHLARHPQVVFLIPAGPLREFLQGDSLKKDAQGFLFDLEREAVVLRTVRLPFRWMDLHFSLKLPERSDRLQSGRQPLQAGLTGEFPLRGGETLFVIPAAPAAGAEEWPGWVSPSEAEMIFGAFSLIVWPTSLPGQAPTPNLMAAKLLAETFLSTVDSGILIESFRKVSRNSHEPGRAKAPFSLEKMDFLLDHLPYILTGDPKAVLEGPKFAIRLGFFSAVVMPTITTLQQERALLLEPGTREAVVSSAVVRMTMNPPAKVYSQVYSPEQERDLVRRTLEVLLKPNPSAAAGTEEEFIVRVKELRSTMPLHEVDLEVSDSGTQQLARVLGLELDRPLVAFRHFSAPSNSGERGNPFHAITDGKKIVLLVPDQLWRVYELFGQNGYFEDIQKGLPQAFASLPMVRVNELGKTLNIGSPRAVHSGDQLKVTIRPWAGDLAGLKKREAVFDTTILKSKGYFYAPDDTKYWIREVIGFSGDTFLVSPVVSGQVESRQVSLLRKKLVDERWDYEPPAAGTEEVSVEVAEGMARMNDFLGRIGSDPSLLFGAGVHDLTESFGESPAIKAFEREGVRPLLLVPGRVSAPAAPLDSPAMKLLVEPRFERALRQQLSFALTAGIVEITTDPRSARVRVVIGGREFVRSQKESRLVSRDATFLQVDPSTVATLTQDFLVLVAAYKPGALLVVGTQAEHSDAVVLFESA